MLTTGCGDRCGYGHPTCHAPCFGIERTPSKTVTVPIRCFGLQRDMRNAKAIAEHTGEIDEDIMPGSLVRNLDMGAHGDQSRGDSPDMHIMHAAHIVDLRQCGSDGGGIDPVRGGLQKHLHGLTQQPPGAARTLCVPSGFAITTNAISAASNPRVISHHHLYRSTAASVFPPFNDRAPRDPCQRIASITYSVR